MLFYSPSFLPFFAVVFGLYWMLPTQASRTWLLVVGSFFFYATWNHWLAILIGVTSVFDYLIGLALDSTNSRRLRRGLLAGSLVMNLGMLGYFKYANFFIDSLAVSLHAAGLPVSLPTLQVILPIGISFYTFEAINYTVDVYSKRVPAERNLSHFLLFILFFPHLVAGPIVRARDFLPQIKRTKRYDWRRIQLGCELFLLGLVKKLVVADRLSVVVDAAFAQPSDFSTSALWLAVFGYAVQIYCDFSGYSDMAIGLAHCFGFKLGRNFDMPYLAENVSMFWRRWHISLSTWLRDYVFIPLGGSRGTQLETCWNLLLTMTLGGLWHGASWTFVIWGMLHGGLLVVHRLFQDAVRVFPTAGGVLCGRAGRAMCIVLTFLCVSLGWVLFRAPTFEIACRVYQGMFLPQFGRKLPVSSTGVLLILVAVALAHGVGQCRSVREGLLHRWPTPVLGLAYAVTLIGMLVLIPENTRPFIYFAF